MLDANIRHDTSGLTAYKMAAAYSTLKLRLCSGPTLRAHIRICYWRQGHFVITVPYPCLFGTMALFFLVIGLRGIMTKKPFLISVGGCLFLIVLGFAPGIVQAVLLPTSSNASGILTALRWMIPILLIVVIFFLSLTLRGYMAFGVTDVSFREGLLAALKRLNLDHEETMSILRLPTIGADLQVAVQSWITNRGNKDEAAEVPQCTS